jgi:MFS family permease
MNGHAGSGRFYGWMTLSAAGLMMFVSMGSMMSFQYFLPILCREFGWSRALVGGVGSVGMVLMGLAAPLAGIIVAKYGARRAILVGNIILVLGLLVQCLQTRPWHLFLGGGLLVGLGAGVGQFIPATTLANNWFVRKRSMALSIITSSASIGGFVLMPATAAVGGALGWRPAYAFQAALVAAFGVVLAGLLIKNKPEDMGQVPDGGTVLSSAEQEHSAKALRKLYTTPVDFTVKEAIRTRAFWMLVLINVASMFGMSMVMMHQIAFLETIGITGVMAATAAGLFAGIGVVGALGVGFLGLRFNMWPLTIACTILAAIGMGLLLIAKTLPIVFFFNIVLGTAMGGFMTVMLGLFASYYGRANFPQILGLTMPFGTLLGGSGALVAGAMYDATGSYALPFTIGALAVSLCVVFIILAPPPRHPSLRS